MEEECTSFIRMCQVNQRSEPMAHSRTFLECPRIFLLSSGISGPSSKDRNDNRGNHTSPDIQTSGLVVGESKYTRDLIFFRNREKKGSMSYDRQPFQI